MNEVLKTLNELESVRIGRLIDKIVDNKLKRR